MNFHDLCEQGCIDSIKMIPIEERKLISPNIIKIGFQLGCSKGHLDVISEIYQWEPKVDIHDDDEFAFRMAALNGHIIILYQLWEWSHQSEKTIDIGAKNEFAFRAACRGGHLDILKQLYEWRPLLDLSVNDEEGFRLACFGDYLEVMKQLYIWNPFINILANDNEAFYIACKNGNLDILQQLYWWDNTVYVDDPEEKVFTIACENQHYDIANQLYLWRKNTINVSYNNDFIFRMACINGYLELIKFLHKLLQGSKSQVELGILIQLGFIIACEYNQVGVIEIFYDWAKKIHIQLNLEIGLKRICEKNHLNLMKQLNEWWPNLLEVTITDDVYFRIACEKGNLEIADFIYRKREITQHPINLRKNKDEYFRLSCKDGNLPLVIKLLEWEPEIDITSRNFEAYTYALFNRPHQDLIVDFFMEKCPTIQEDFEEYCTFLEKCQSGDLDYIRPNASKYDIEIITEKIQPGVFGQNVINFFKDYLFLFSFCKMLENTGELDECSICTEEKVEVETMCKHQFCITCLIQWITRNQTCPLCRQNIGLIYV